MTLMDRRRGLMAVTTESPDILPDDYQAVLWIRASAKTKSYIATEVQAGALGKIVIDAIPYASGDPLTAITFVSSVKGSKRFGFFSNYNSYYRAFACAPSVSWGTTGNRAEYEFSIYNGYSGDTGTIKLYGAADENCKSYALYSVKMYDGHGVALFRSIPCYRKSDNKIGLYDFVSNKFYPCSGTFSKGGNV